nr:hypothetical protein GCM10020063_107650 [Dactylosporangium thailandense]
MPRPSPAGQLAEPPVGLLPAERREFFDAIKLFHGALGMSYGGLARALHRVKSSVSDYCHGKLKRPDPAFLTDLCDLAVKTLGEDRLPMPRARVQQIREDLELQQAGRQRCSACPAARTGRLTQRPAESGGAGPDARDRPVGDGPANATRGSAAAIDRLPVPRPEGDRQLTIATDRLGIRDLNARLVAGQLADAVGILRHLGLDVPPPETAAALAACRSEGLADAESALIVHAAQRAVRDVMIIAKVLLDGDHIDLAKDLLGAGVG